MKSYLLALLLAVAKATIGVDYADAFSLSDLQCLKSHGIQFAVIRAWHSYGSFDYNAVPSIKIAR